MRSPTGYDELAFGDKPKQSHKRCQWALLVNAPLVVLTPGQVTNISRAFRASSLTTFPAMDGTALNNCVSWTEAWQTCTLDMPSIENALKVCIDSGQTGQTTVINGVPYGSWSQQAIDDHAELTGPRGWTITTS